MKLGLLVFWDFNLILNKTRKDLIRQDQVKKKISKKSLSPSIKPDTVCFNYVILVLMVQWDGQDKFTVLLMGFTVKYCDGRPTVIKGFIIIVPSSNRIQAKTWFCRNRVCLSKYIFKITSYLSFQSLFFRVEGSWPNLGPLPSGDF